MPEVRPPDAHESVFSTVYVNRTGLDAMDTVGIPKFPQGSVIVKEKLLSRDKRIPQLLTVMIKREKGFNSAAEDWEFVTLDSRGTQILSRDEEGKCLACHEKQKKNDFVFRDYIFRERAERAEKSENVIRGDALKHVTPEYPEEAKKAKIGGDVVVEVTYSRLGVVTHARIISGHPLLQEVSLNAARQWLFKPETGPHTGILTFRFTL